MLFSDNINQFNQGFANCWH